jgi:hydrogenase expression/formation protein HypD
MNESRALEYLKNYAGRPLTLMEVCGSHTAVLERFAIRELLSPRIRLVSGPGCPVCVTPAAELDRLCRLSLQPGCTVACFNDLLRVPGSDSTLQQVMAGGGSVLTFLSPLEMLEQAAARPDRQFLVAAIGFETTAPLYARLLSRTIAAGLANIHLISSLRQMPPVLRHLFDQPDCPDGFLAPGHVSAIIGSAAYEPLAAASGRSFVIAGFTPEQVILGLARLVSLTARGEAAVFNDYPQLVAQQGNLLAQEAMARYFEPAPILWRGLGSITGSGLRLRQTYAGYGWPAADLITETENGAAAGTSCRCGDILTGRLRPRECAAFGRQCRPEQPLGPCMVSNEGACGLAYTYRQEDPS